MVRINKVYTRTGDKGITSLVGGQRVSKASARLEAYGTVDELSSHLGLLAALTTDANDRKLIEHIQNTLFAVGTQLATDTDNTPLPPSASISRDDISMLETEIDRLTALLPPQQGFILPGGTVAAAEAHVCRTVCRRAERCMVELAEKTQLNEEVTAYVNRLSDYLFVMARKLNADGRQEEKNWNPKMTM